MTPAKPSLNLLPALTDEHVLRALMSEKRLTRAELATRTGISKPTVSESVRRLSEAGTVVDTGERTTGRGRIGSYYALSDAVAGCGLAISIAPDGVVAETLDAHGVVIARTVERIQRAAGPDQVAETMVRTVRRAHDETGPTTRLTVVSAADPVDRRTGRLIHLPDAPFLVGELSPADVLAGLVDGPVLVDNDINWAARAEREAGADQLDDFAYLYLGEGLGCAVISDGVVRRGNSGLAGEIAHLTTTGPGGRAMRFTEVFSVLGLRQPGLTAIDIDVLLSTVQGRSSRSAQVLHTLTAAICGVLGAIVALSDPEVIIVGGPWGAHRVVLEAVTAAFAADPRRVLIKAPAVTNEPALAGARTRAVHELQNAIIRSATHPGRPVVRF